MRKNIIILPFICISFSMVALCACGQNRAAEVLGVPEDISVMPAANILNKTEENVSAIIAEETEKTLLQENAMEMYEAYLDTCTDNDYLYTYYDYDQDGSAELYVRRKPNDSGNSYGEVLKYINGGLTDIEHGIVPDEHIKTLDWSATLDASQTIDEDELLHEGFDAYIRTEPNITKQFWYPDKNTFLSAYGFADANPFYTYALPDSTSRLTLYYDEQTQSGCGVLFRTWTLYTSDIVSDEYGFSFHGPEKLPESWEDNLQFDYMKPESIENYTYSNLPEYTENIEYDESGRIIHFISNGVLDFMDADEPETLLSIDYIYDENGILTERDYHHNPNAYGTGYQVWTSYFDDLGRLVHEYIYITHGALYYYYIYIDEDDMPAYCLYLDDNGGYWIADFYKY
ncbi:MAG: hypothetical protein NC314_12305 [Roseburia sp.]|nr:hypothetical protein [Roseburia sp.]MCM1243616.1 hypothetical protein [Roseburia sp.]